MVKCVSAGQVVACLHVCVSVSECVLGLMSVLAVVDLCTMGRALTGCEERMRKRARSARRHAKTKKKGGQICQTRLQFLNFYNQNHITSTKWKIYLLNASKYI